ncbi:hypothetical protein [Variovorax sp. RO1]|uniref:hypothetical protein n=1 Tax=Variovorax sp. RO1 TaxID=2066034 RepID=UPI000C716783|nr:hypothetical protein [Variovorax sp. RO1]
MQRLLDGTVQFTPAFDFAPMYLNIEVIDRGCHWRDEQVPPVLRVEIERESARLVLSRASIAWPAQPMA